MFACFSLALLKSPSGEDIFCFLFLKRRTKFSLVMFGVENSKFVRCFVFYLFLLKFSCGVMKVGKV